MWNQDCWSKLSDKIAFDSKNVFLLGEYVLSRITRMFAGVLWKIVLHFYFLEKLSIRLAVRHPEEFLSFLFSAKFLLFWQNWVCVKYICHKLQPVKVCWNNRQFERSTDKILIVVCKLSGMSARPGPNEFE